MADEPKPHPESERGELPMTQYGAVAFVAKLVANLTTERFLTLFVCGVLGVLVWKQLDQFAEWQARTDRMNAEQRESDKRDCVAREERIRADNLALDKAQLDAVRLMQKDLIAHWASEAEKNRAVIVEAVKAEVSRLAGKNEASPLTGIEPPDSPPP